LFFISATFKVQDKIEEFNSPESEFVALPPLTTFPTTLCCYPGGNFEKNQLPGGSMSLSPL